MTAIDTPTKETTEKKMPLAGWQRWLEFLQILAVLVIGCGVALPFVTGFAIWAWISLPASIAVGGGLAFAASRLVIAAPPEITEGQQFEITRIRLRIFAANGTPRDVLWALMAMRDAMTKRWTGSADEFRKAFYKQIGEKRGMPFVNNLLPYLAIYAPEQPQSQPQSTPDVSTAPQQPRTKLLDTLAQGSADPAVQAKRPATSTGVSLGDAR